MEEPKRQSYLDVLKYRLKLAHMFAHTTRYLYIGQYHGPQAAVQEKMKNNVTELNEEFGQLVFTGILLLYPKFFLHLIEATKTSMYRHLQGVFINQSDKILGRTIFLPSHQNIYKTYFDNWYDIPVPNPPVLLNPIEKFELPVILDQIRNCLTKMYLLSEYIMDIGAGSDEKIFEASKTLDRDAPHYLPELTIVEYLVTVKTPVIEDVRVYFEKFCRIPFINLYNDRIWPPISGFLPRSASADERKQE